MPFDTPTIRAVSVAKLDESLDLDLTSRHFMVLLIFDDRGIDDEMVRAFARRMIDSGAVFLCVWAPDSQRVLQLFLEVTAEYPATDDRFLMCAGREQRFEQMLWYFLYATRPARRARRSAWQQRRLEAAMRLSRGVRELAIAGVRMLCGADRRC
jgi:hypothetical protein